MEDKVQIVVPLRIYSALRTRGTAKSGTVIEYDEASYKEFKERVANWAVNNEQIKEAKRRLKGYTGLSVNITTYYKVANGDFWELPKLTSPDVDNISKALLDTLVIGELKRDDSTVFRLLIEKFYADRDYAVVEIQGYKIAKYTGNKSKVKSKSKSKTSTTEDKNKERKAQRKKNEKDAITQKNDQKFNDLLKWQQLNS